MSGGHSEVAKTVVTKKKLKSRKAQPSLRLRRNDKTTLNIECNFPLKLYGNMYMISMKIYYFRECSCVSLLKEIFPGNMSFELFIKCIAMLNLVLVSMG